MMGAQPGDCSDTNTFTLPSHESESLTEEESAERIATHFAEISNELPALDINSLPARVQTKLSSTQKPPIISEYETYNKIRAAKKPKSGIPNDLPKLLVQEFGTELATPVSKIINNIVQTGEWPNQWKLEYVSPIGKVPMPESEDELRPISLTAYFSKVTEHFVVMWLMEFIKDKIDFRQYGGMKGNSIAHYLIEFINFILMNQDSQEQTAILACLVDFQKAFNRINHNLIITKLSDMGVPGWLLKIVVAFLKDRKMLVRYKGKHSSIKSLPAGGPQGTLLGLLLFIILINEVGFEGQVNNLGDLLTARKNMKSANLIHMKYVDDLSFAEAINLPEKLRLAPNRQQPDNFHARTGHILPVGNSEVFKQLLKTEEYAKNNDMKMNLKKTKLVVFNPCKSRDFIPEFTLQGQTLEVVDKFRILGLIVSSDLSNSEYIVSKANKRLWIIRRLKALGATTKDLIEIYITQVRSVLEFAVPVWQSNISLADKANIERVQKSFCHIILGEKYHSYKNALEVLSLETLEIRRNQLCLRFARKCEKHDKFKNWFKLNTKNTNTRSEKLKYCQVQARLSRLEKSPISFLTNMLNEHYQKSK